MKIKAFIFVAILCCGCSAKPLSDIKEDAIRERYMLAKIVSDYQHGNLDCQSAMSLISMQSNSESIDSIMENTYR